MGKLKYLTGKPSDGKMYYSVVFLIGYFFAKYLAKIDLPKETWFSARLFIGGMITAAGARFYNRVLVPRYQLWKAKRRRRKNQSNSLGES